MRWSRVCVEAIGYEMPEERVLSSALEGQIEPFYRKLHISGGQLEALTGVRERRYWPPNVRLSEPATLAARRALQTAGLEVSELGALIYGGVCRENLEPATACAVAAGLGLSGNALVLDHANACLGVLNGMVTVANMIELGQIRAGLVVASESAREIGESTVARMLAEPKFVTFRQCMATLTGGSGSVAVLLTDESLSQSGRRLLGGVAVAAPEHHQIARWGPSEGLLGETAWVMETDAAAVLNEGVKLGKRTWSQFLAELEWTPEDVDRVICHQVGAAHREQMLAAMRVPLTKDFSTFEDYGNVGTVSLPFTAARAAEEGFLSSGDRVGFLGIGTGLNCLMLGLRW